MKNISIIRVGTIFLIVLSLIFGILNGPVYATDVPLLLTSNAEALDVTVSSSITLTGQPGTADLKVSDITIQNNMAIDSAKITSISAAASDNWKLVSKSSDFATMAADAKKLYIGYEEHDFSSGSVDTEIVVEAKQSKNLSLAAKTGIVTNDIKDVKVATTVLTIEYIDLQAPEIVMDIPENNSEDNPEIVESTAVVVEGTATDNIGVSKVTVDGKAVEFDEEGTFSTQITVTEGITTGIVIEAADVAGNISKKTWYVKPMPTFAIYSSTDQSLTFYKRESVPEKDSTFEGKAVTAVYTNVASLEATSSSGIPWYTDYASVITSVSVADEGISPKNISYWFYNFKNCETYDLGKLDASSVERIDYTFYYAGMDADSLTIDLSNWTTSKQLKSLRSTFMFAGYRCPQITINVTGLDVSAVDNMDSVFYYLGAAQAKNIEIIGLNTWNTSACTNMNNAFNSIASYSKGKVKLDLSSWSTEANPSMSGIFSSSPGLTEITFGEDWAWVGTNGYLPEISGTDGLWYNCVTSIGYTPAELAEAYNADPAGMAGTYAVSTSNSIPGLYDASGTMLAAWSKLTSTYGMDISKDYSTSSSAENYYKTNTASPYYVLTNNAELTEGTMLMIASGPTVIGKYAFYDCDGLESIIVQDGATTIGIYSFATCANLKEVTIPESITRIGAYAFTRSISLTNINVDEANSNYCDVDGILFNKNKTTLEKYPASKPEAAYEIPEGVKNITFSAFESCKNLTEITIPDSVTSIGNSAFSGCSNLEDVTISNNVTKIGNSVFSGCSSLENITIPSSVTSFDNYAFYYCSGLTEITIPDSVKTIGDSVFSGCSSLTEITIPNNVTSIGNSVFSSCSRLERITLPNTITSFGSSVLPTPSDSYIDGADGKWYNMNTGKGYSVSDFAAAYLADPEGMAGLYVASKTFLPGLFDADGNLLASWTELTTTYGMDVSKDYTYSTSKTDTASPYYVLTNNSELSSGTILVMDSSVSNIGAYAFYDCKGLTEVNISETVTRIENNAFYSCTGLTEITIPKGVTYISINIFGNCTSLTSINVAENNPKYTSKDGVLFDKEKTTLYSYPIGKTETSYAIPDSVTRINDFAFDGCKGLTGITIPESVTTLGNYAFGDCINLAEISIPSSVQTILGQAFYECDSLTEITIPEGVTSIGNYAFYSCSGLREVTIPSTVTSFGTEVFNYCRKLEKVVMNNSVVSLSTSLQAPSSSYIDGADGKWYDIDTGMGYAPAEIPTGAATYVASQSLIPGLFDADGNLLASWTELTTTYGMDVSKDYTYSTSKTDTASPYYVLTNNSDLSGGVKLVMGSGATSIGSCAFYSCSSLSEVTISENVEEISEYAFYGCSSLSEVIIPDSVTDIGFWAFYGCSSLSEVTLPGSVIRISNGVFVGCSSLESINVDTSNPAYSSVDGVLFNKLKTVINIYPSGKTADSYVIPDGVVKIGDSAFYECAGLTSITIPEGVTTIDTNAFNGCSGLSSVVLPDSVTSLGLAIFQNCSGLTSITIPSGVNSINWAAFSDCSSLSEVIIPDSVTIIDGYAFTDCTSLESITIPEDVTTIGTYAFSGCTSLTSITIPEGVTTIGTYAFINCSSLESITLPTSITSIGSNALPIPEDPPIDGADGDWYSIATGTGYSASDLATAYLADPSGMAGTYVASKSLLPGLHDADGNLLASWTELTTTYGMDVSKDYTYSTSKTDTASPYYVLTNNSELSGGVKLVMGSGATSIGNYAFYSCSSLSEVTISENVKDIGDEAFYGCSSLSEVTIPGSVKDIGNRAFKGCSSLSEVTIPGSVTSIMNGAFEGCSNLESINVDTSNPTYSSVDGVLFNKLKTAIITYPLGKTADSYVIPDGVVKIGYAAFCGCTGLSSITIPEGVTTIDTNAFKGCSGLSSVILPDSVTSLGNAIFQNCSGLTSITIPSGVNSISWGAFGGCSSLSEVIIPDSVTIIDGYAFTNCTSLESITIPEGVTTIGTDAFSGCTSLESIAIPEGVTTIGSYAFINCSSLESITLPTSITSIGSNALLEPEDPPIDGADGDWYSMDTGIGYTPADLATAYLADPTGMAGTYVASKSLLPGLHDADGNLLASWTELTTTYGMDVSKDYDPSSSSEDYYQTNTASPYSVLNNNAALANGTKLVMGSNTSIIGAYAFADCNLESIKISESVSTIRYHAFYNCGSLTKVTIPYSVTSIGSSAFNNCGSLTKVTIPYSVTSIGSSAFNNCSSLTSIEVDEANSNYCDVDDVLFNKNKTRLERYPEGKTAKSYAVPNSVTRIAESAFRDCISLESITIPNGVTSFVDYAFYGCSSLKEITIPDSVTSIGGSAFYGCSNLKDITISNNVTKIGTAVFYGCSSLENITIPSGVTSIGNSAFSGCSSLKEITIPDNLTSIGSSAFNNCSNLTSITIPNSATSIGRFAFNGCSSLESITLPSSITSFNSSALPTPSNTYINGADGNWYNMDTGIGYTPADLATAYLADPTGMAGTYVASKSLLPGLHDADGNLLASWNELVNTYGMDITKSYSTSSYNTDTASPYYVLTNNAELSSGTKLVMGSGPTSIGERAFYFCTSLESVTIPEGITSIGNAAFQDCTGLTNVTIPSSVTSIENSAFARCTSLTSITIPDEVTIIGVSTFYGCTNLETITLPSSLTSIGDSAFEDCSSLTSITLPSSLISIGESAFYNCSSLTSIEIPEGVTSIESSTFNKCTGLTSVTIPEGITSFGTSAFKNCTSLESITLPSTIMSFGSSALPTPADPPIDGADGKWYNMNTGKGYTFADLATAYLADPSGMAGTYVASKNLLPGLHATDGTFTSWNTLVSNGDVTVSGTSVTDANTALAGKLIISSDITSIESRALQGCSGLTEITIPEGLTSIGSYAFLNCSGLTNVNLPEGLTSIGSYAFSNCTNLTSITIPKGVTSLPTYIFNGCTRLTNINLPEGLISFATNALRGLISLTEITIPESVTDIGNSAFLYTGLTEITIPEGVTSIGNEAFAACQSLTSVYFEQIVAPTFGSNCFNKTTGSVTTFYFRNATVSNALVAGTHYNATYGTKSTNYTWTASLSLREEEQIDNQAYWQDIVNAMFEGQTEFTLKDELTLMPIGVVDAASMTEANVTFHWNGTSFTLTPESINDYADFNADESVSITSVIEKCNETERTGEGNTPPVLEVTVQADSSVKGCVIVSGTASDSDSGLESLKINGLEIEVAGDGSWSTAIALSGTKTLTITATDKDGNETTVTWSDEEGPVLLINLPETSLEAPYESENSPFTLSGCVTDAKTAPYALLVNGQEITVSEDGSWSIDIEIPEGSTIEVVLTATDYAGNAAAKNIYLKLISAEGSGSEGAGEAEEITPSEDENTSSEEDTSSEESIEGEPTSQTSEDESTDPQAA